MWVVSQSAQKRFPKQEHEVRSKGVKKRKKRNAFHIRRGLIEQSTRGLEITELMKNIDFQSLSSSIDVEGCRDQEVKACLDVERCPGGLFLKGDVAVDLSLRCERCGEPFSHPIKSSFEAWANAKIRSLEECMDLYELPFPPSSNSLDITEIVGLAIAEGFPRLLICGTSDCAIATYTLNQEMELGTPSTEMKVNQFSVLKDLRNALKNQQK